MVFYVPTEKLIGFAMKVARAYKQKALKMLIYLKLVALTQFAIKSKLPTEKGAYVCM